MQSIRGAAALFLAKPAAVGASAVSRHSAQAPHRNAVNLAALKLRIRATGNVSKLTSVMKMVANSKLRSVENAVAQSRPFGESILNAVQIREEGREKAKNEDAAQDILIDGKKHLLVAITTDRGLCGAVNSSLSRSVRKEVNAAAKAGAPVKIFVLGDKGRAQIAREYLPVMTKAIDTYLDQGITFALASSIASQICAQDYEVLTLCFNHYENQVRFTLTYKKLPQFLGLPVGVLPSQLKGFEIEPENNEETLVNMQEYAVASAILFAMLETSACETAQRVTAMDNASKNSKDMVDSLKLTYNRGRQAKITSELAEIVSGAESLVQVTASD